METLFTVLSVLPYLLAFNLLEIFRFIYLLFLH